MVKYSDMQLIVNYRPRFKELEILMVDCLAVYPSIYPSICPSNVSVT